MDTFFALCPDGVSARRLNCNYACLWTRQYQVRNQRQYSEDHFEIGLIPVTTATPLRSNFRMILMDKTTFKSKREIMNKAEKSGMHLTSYCVDVI